MGRRECTSQGLQRDTQIMLGSPQVPLSYTRNKLLLPETSGKQPALNPGTEELSSPEQPKA